MMRGSSLIKENPRPELWSWSELKPKSKIIPLTFWGADLPNGSSAPKTLSKFLKLASWKEISQPNSLNLLLAFMKPPLSWSSAIIFTPGFFLQISRLCPPPPNVPSTTISFSFPAFCGANKPSIASFKRTVLCLVTPSVFVILFAFVSKPLCQLLRLLRNHFLLLRPCLFIPNLQPVPHSDNCRFVPKTYPLL